MSESRLRPFPEARPPHLADAVAGRSPWVYVFLAVAVVNLYAAFRATAQIPSIDLALIYFGVVSSIPAVVAPLLGVVLFNQDRRAWLTMPALAFGLALLAVDYLVSGFSDLIIGFLLESAPDGDALSPAVTAFGVFEALLTVFAILYVGVGLSLARRQPRARIERPMLVWFVALGVVSAVLSIAATSSAGIDMTPEVLVRFGLGIVLSLASTLAWAYLTAVIVGGWAAREEPMRAWKLAAVAVIILVLIPLVVTTLTAVTSSFLGQGFSLILGSVNAVAWVLLLLAFVLGLATRSSAPTDEATADPRGAMPPGSGAG